MRKCSLFIAEPPGIDIGGVMGFFEVQLPELDYWPYEELEKVGARVVINDPQGTIDPKFGLMIVSPLEALKFEEEKLKKILGKIKW